MAVRALPDGRPVLTLRAQEASLSSYDRTQYSFSLGKEASFNVSVPTSSVGADSDAKAVALADAYEDFMASLGLTPFPNIQVRATTDVGASETETLLYVDTEGM